MKNRSEIVSQERGDTTEWFIWKPNGDILDLQKVFEAGIIECVWQAEDRNFITVFYYAWDTTELFAIIDKNAAVVRKGIKSIIEFIKDEQLFIVQFEGRWLQPEQLYYGLADEEWKMAVIKGDGSFLIEPNYSSIVFDEDQKIFVADRTSRFDLLGCALE